MLHIKKIGKPKHTMDLWNRYLKLKGCKLGNLKKNVFVVLSYEYLVLSILFL